MRPSATLGSEVAALIDADPGAPSAPPPGADEAGIDEASLNGADSSRESRPGDAAIVTAQEFAAVEEAGADPLVGEPGQAIIPEGGDCMLYGDGGASKTTLSIDLAVHLAAGDDWLGLTVPAPATVLVIEAEGPRPLFREKLRRKLAGWRGSDLADRLLVLERPWASFRFPDGDEVADLVAQHQVDVLIVGPLTRVGMEELGTLQQVQAFTAEVERFRRRAGRRLTVFLVHHENKGGKVSGAWEGAGDTLLHAQVHGPGKTTLTFQKVRWASTWHRRALELAWTAGEGFEALGDAGRDEAERDYAAEIEALLGDGKWRTLEEISAASRGGIGANKDAVREALNAHPGRFPSCTGDAAKALGRRPNATLWKLAQASEPVEPEGGSQGPAHPNRLTGSPLREPVAGEPDQLLEPEPAQRVEPGSDAEGAT